MTRTHARAALAIAAAVLIGGQADAQAPVEAPSGQGQLRVCSDPDNMPFSNIRLEGFENKIAALLAADLGLTVSYAWGAEYRGFLRKTLQSGACDVVMGISGDVPRIAATRPYYSSAYVFVWPSDRERPSGFDDPALKSKKIGLHAVGMEGANSPPAMALARRALGPNVVGFSVWGEAPDAQGRLIGAVAEGKVDLALAWGPVAGYFAHRYGGRLSIAAAAPDPAMPDVPFAYAISLGVRKDDVALRDRLQAALDHQRDRIAAVLNDFHVPLVDAPDITAPSAAAKEKRT